MAHSSGQPCHQKFLCVRFWSYVWWGEGFYWKFTSSDICLFKCTIIFFHLFYESIAYVCSPICSTCHDQPLIFLLMLVSSPSARSSPAWHSVEPGAALTSLTVLTCLCCQLSPLKSKHCKTQSVIISKGYRWTWDLVIVMIILIAQAAQAIPSMNSWFSAIVTWL